MADLQLESTLGAVAAKISAAAGPLHGLPLESLTPLAASGKLVRADIGRVIIQPGKMPEAVFIVLEGRIRILGSGPENSHPELIQTLRTGGIAGIASLLAGTPVEAATVSENAVCLMIEAPRFLEFLDKNPDLRESLAHQVSAPELYNLLAGDLARNALDIEKAGIIVRSQLTEARLLNGTGSTETAAEYMWWIASGASRGLRWSPDDGPVRRIGLPARILAEIKINSTPSVTDPAPLHLPSAETLMDPMVDYPSVITSAGAIEEVNACYEMLTKFHKKNFPKDAIRRVLQNEVQSNKAPTLNTCGTVAAMAGFAAQLVRIPANHLARVETPALLSWEGTICVLFEATQNRVSLANPQKGLQRMSLSDFLASNEGEINILLTRPLPDEEKEKFGFKWFLPSIRKHKRALIEVFVASLFIQLFGLANPLLTQVIIDKVLVQNSLSALNVLGVLFIVIALADTALTALRTYLFVDTTNRIDLALGSRIMDHLYKLKLGYFQRRPVGEVSSRLHELENIRQFLTGTALTVGLDALFSVIYMGIMFFYSISLSFVALGVIPFMAGVTLFGAPILRRQILRRSEEGARTQSHVIETITGVQTVKAGNIEHHSRWEWQKRYAGFVSAGFHAVLTSTAMNSTTNILSRLGDLAVLWYGAVLVIKGDLTLGQLIAFRIIAGNVTTPLMRLSQSWQNFQEVALSVQRLGDVLNSPTEQTVEQGGNIPMPQIKGKVEFDSVTFTYIPGQQPQLRNVSFEIPEGSFVGVVGKSGSGKSTVLKLLPRLYSADSGRILLDDYEVAKVELYSLRRQIGTVLQDSLLFNSSVFSNIAVSDPDATPEEVMRAARVAGAHDFIMGLPEGYNTCVGEQGRALSGGQRQRIAIARTVLQRPRLLILDEATSALDFPSEHLVCKNLAKEFLGRTVFFVTHRVRSVEHADRILVLDRGILVENGTHEELMKLNGIYRTLYMGKEDEK
jgi:subfamily B ATP-binding cassette protein HlyB/CyaB